MVSPPVSVALVRIALGITLRRGDHRFDLRVSERLAGFRARDDLLLNFGGRRRRRQQVETGDGNIQIQQIVGCGHLAKPQGSPLAAFRPTWLSDTSGPGGQGR